MLSYHGTVQYHAQLAKHSTNACFFVSHNFIYKFSVWVSEYHIISHYFGHIARMGDSYGDMGIVLLLFEKFRGFSFERKGKSMKEESGVRALQCTVQSLDIP